MSPCPGAHYNYFRDFDPGIGRYLQSDPIGLDGGINTYEYAASRPLLEVDPRGESSIAMNPGFGAGAAGASGVCWPCIGAYAGGFALGTGLYNRNDVAILDFLVRAGKGRWTCTAKCNHTAIPPNNCCNPPHLTGVGSGHSQEAACRAAKRDATTSASPGCYGRHCRCTNCWKN